jgi:O-antigen/teichoic acid export membrane protein
VIRELFKDMTKYFPSIIVPAVVGIIALPFFTRLFPPADYGNYIVVTSTVTVVSIIAIQWLASSTPRFFPIYEQNNEIPRFYSTILKSSLLSILFLGVIFFGVLYLVQSYIPSTLYSLMRIGILLFIGTSLMSVFTSLLRARRQATWYSFFTVWRSVGGLGLGVALVIVFRFGVEGLLWGSLLSILAILPLLWKASIGNPSLREGSVRSPMTREIAKFGIPTIVINLLTWALSLSDRYILEFFRGSQEVGIYSASYAVSEYSIFLIVTFFQLASSPIAYNIWEKQGLAPSQDFVSKLTRYYLLISLPAAIGLSVLAKPIAGILFAPEYLPGYLVIPLVALGALLAGLAQEFSLGLDYYKRTDLNMFCFLGAVSLNIGLNFAFIPKYGYIAAAATTFASYALLPLLTAIVSRRFFVFNFPFKSLGKIAASSAVMAAAVYPVGNSLSSSTLVNLIAAISIGVVVYVLMLFLLREFQKDEIQELRSIGRKILARFSRKSS